MKATTNLITFLFLGMFFYACNSTPAEQTSNLREDSLNVKQGWKLGVQLWTFHQYPFDAAIEKADSAGIKYLEAFPGQVFGNLQDTLDLNMSAAGKARTLDILQQKGMKLLALGVVVPRSIEEWKRTFEFAKDLGVQYITAEPLREHWDTINTMAGEYKIMIAIHDHPRPSPYDHPDSVMAAINGRINLGACADLGHWARNGLDVVQCLKTLEGRIIGVHLKDIDTFNKVTAKDVVLGTGVIPFADVFAELRRQGFNGMFSIEHESETPQIVSEVKKNKEFFEQVTKQLK